MNCRDKINQKIASAHLGVRDLTAPCFKNSLWGVVLRDTPLRNLPNVTPRPSDHGFDLNCETLCRCCEPVVFTENSPTGDFYKVQTICSTGFIHKDFVAKLTRNEGVGLLTSERLLCITDKFVLTNPSPGARVSKVPLSFGSKIPVVEKGVNYRVLLPYMKGDGSAGWEYAAISKSPGVNEGHVAFTRKNILQLSLRMRGMPYDWGESFGGCDCSSLVRAAFSLCGINLPRNSSDIARLPFKTLPVNCGIRSLEKCRPADIIAGDGHVMLYYGKKRGIHYVFHSFYGTRGITDITPVTEPASDGAPIYEKFRKIIPLFCT